MAGFPVGVAVLTAFDLLGNPKGMTCSSLCSVTLEPPTLLVSVRRESATLHAMAESGGFALNLLHARARPAAELFSSRLADRFDHVPWRHDVQFAGPILPASAHSAASCLVDEMHEVGDHTVVFGVVTRVRALSRGMPLIYGMRRYGVWRAGSVNGPDEPLFERLHGRGKQ